MNKQMHKIAAISSILYGFVTAGCQANLAEELLPSDTISAEKPSQVMGAVQDAVVAVGYGLAAESGGQAVQGKVQGKVSSQVSLVDVLCNEHAMPLDAQGDYLDTQDPDYPQRLFYCKLAQNSGSPDSIPGSLQVIKAISCAVEKAGVVFDNQDHQVTVTADTSCFTQQQLNDMGIGQMVATIRASKPAFFNSYYDTGISITTAEFGTYKLAAKVSGTTIEFLTHEDQSAVSANKSGAFAASLDILTGKLRFESRSDRFLCAEPSSCGWSRHERILATIAMSNGQITGVSNIEGIASDIYDVQIENGIGQYAARIATIKGNLNQGLKTRYYHVASPTNNDLGDNSKYVEVVNNRCHTYVSDTADCGANTGIQLAAQGAYVFGLHPSANSTSPADWMAQLVGLQFNSVSFADIE